MLLILLKIMQTYMQRAKIQLNLAVIAEKMPDRKSLLGEAYDNSQEISPEVDNSVRNGALVGIESVSVEVPINFELSQNYQNPFNSFTTINYQLPEDCHVLIKIYNAQEQEIKTLVDEYKAAAYYTVH